MDLEFDTFKRFINVINVLLSILWMFPLAYWILVATIAVEGYDTPSNTVKWGTFVSTFVYMSLATYRVGVYITYGY